MPLPGSFLHCAISPGSSHLMFHYSGLVETSCYMYTVDYQCMAYAQVHRQAILLPRSIFSSDLHCSTEIKIVAGLLVYIFLIPLSNFLVLECMVSDSLFWPQVTKKNTFYRVWKEGIWILSCKGWVRQKNPGCMVNPPLLLPSPNLRPHRMVHLSKAAGNEAWGNYREIGETTKTSPTFFCSLKNNLGPNPENRDLLIYLFVSQPF